MSVKLMGMVYDIDLPLNEQAVLLAMADHADHEGGGVYPSNGLIAWKLGLHEPSVRRLKAKLVERKILVVVTDCPGVVRSYRIDISAGTPKPAFIRKNKANMKPFSPPLPRDGGSKVGPPLIPARDPRSSQHAFDLNHIKDEPSISKPLSLCSGENEKTIAAKSAPEKGKTDSFQKDFIEAFSEAFLIHFGAPYGVAWGRDGKAIKELRALGLSVNDLMGWVRKAWKNGSGFFSKNAASIQGFQIYYSRIVAELKAAQEKPHGEYPGYVNRNLGTMQRPEDYAGL